MKLKKWAPLGLAIILGLFAAKFAKDAIARSHSATAANGKAVRVVVAKANINPGQQLNGDCLTVASIAADTIPAGAFKDLAEVNGRVARAQIFAGQAVVQELLAASDAGTGLQALVPKGMRAVTVQVDEMTSVGGLLLPGCRVDVVVTVNDANTENTTARTIVQNVLVSAVGQRLTAGKPDSDKPDLARSITLIATPRDVEAIELASSHGRPRLVLRSGKDNGVTESTGVTLCELRGRPAGGRPSGADPFATTVVQPIHVPAPKPEQSEKTDVTPTSTIEVPQRWHVTLLNAGSASDLIFEMPSPRSTVTATDNTPATPATSGN